MNQPVDRDYVARIRAAVSDATLVAAELWRLAIFERRCDVDARAADERLTKLEEILVDAERALVEEERRIARQAARDAARVERLMPVIREKLVDGPASARDLSMALGTKPALVEMALAELATRREVTRSDVGFALSKAA